MARSKYHVGDTVVFTIGKKHRGEIVEEHGPLGGGGRYLYRVQVNWYPEPMFFELAEDEIEKKVLRKVP